MLELADVTVTFSAPGGPLVRAVDGVSATLSAGSFVVVIGTNGSGKSTLLGAIAGTVRVDSGSIRLAGQDITRWREDQRARLVGRVFQDPRAGTAASLTVLENIAVAACRGTRADLSWATSRGLRDEAAARLGAIVPGLEGRLDQPIGSLSGGQRQIVTLVMATWRRPELLLLDEHTAALDPRSAELVIGLTTRLVAKSSSTTIMVTHSMQQAATLGDRLVAMHRGRVYLDVSGAEKSRLGEADLLALFTQMRRDDRFDDRACDAVRRLYA